MAGLFTLAAAVVVIFGVCFIALALGLGRREARRGEASAGHGAGCACHGGSCGGTSNASCSKEPVGAGRG